MRKNFAIRMKMRTTGKYLTRALLIFPALLSGLSACSWLPTVSWDKTSDAQVGVVPYSPDSLWNLQTGRDYAAAGRYELAREHYLLGLASSNDPAITALLEQELRGVDMMIKTVR